MDLQVDRRLFLLGGAAAGGAVVVRWTWPGFALSAAAETAGAVPGPSPYGDLGTPDANGVRLPQGFTSRVVATSGQTVPGTAFLWHVYPDGAAVLPMSDGGWAYASNSEATPGGVGVLRFSSHGEVSEAYSVLAGTARNCSGGGTPWGTWLSCEERALGKVYECDPSQPGNGAVRPALGVFAHEAVAVDFDDGRLYLTEDAPSSGGGELYRFTPAALLPDLSDGTLEVCLWDAETRSMSWLEVDPSVPAETRRATPGATKGSPFAGGEGAWYDAGHVYFCTKLDGRLWDLDVALQQLDVLWDANDYPDPVLSGVDNLVMAPTGDLFVCEDGGNLEIVVLTWDRQVAPFLRVEGQAGSELTGAAFDPANRRLYFSSQRGGSGTGITYEVSGPFMWFRDVAPGHPFFDEIGGAAAAGAARGFADRTFRPDVLVTRQAVAAFLHRLAGSPDGPFPDPGFSDVPAAHTFHEEIAWLADEGIATGFADGRFRPGAPISRQAVAAFLHRAHGAPAGPFPDPGFSDVAEDSKSALAVAWLAKSGITTGYPDGTFRPGAPVTRQAMAAYLCRLVELAGAPA
jgi:hypothetical protein